MGGDSPCGEPRPFFLQSFLKHEMVTAWQRTILSDSLHQTALSSAPSSPTHLQKPVRCPPEMELEWGPRPVWYPGPPCDTQPLPHRTTRKPLWLRASANSHRNPNRGAHPTPTSSLEGQSLTQIVVPVLTDVQDTSDVINGWLGRATSVGLS